MSSKKNYFKNKTKDTNNINEINQEFHEVIFLCYNI